jgi:hypothetical protein
MIDALGVKRSWGDNPMRPSAEALQALRDGYNAAAGARGYLMKAGIPRSFQSEFGARATVSVVSLSDTIVAVATLAGQGSEAAHAVRGATEGQVASVDDETLGGLVDLVCVVSAYAMRVAAQSDRALVYRGAVTTGTVLVDIPETATAWQDSEAREVLPPGVFLLGPAIGEADRCHQLAEGGFVWLTASAARLPAPKVTPYRQILYDYVVPMKDGRTVSTKVVTPFVDLGVGQPRDPVRSGYERAFDSGGQEAAAKRDNTIRLLNYLAQQA